MSKFPLNLQDLSPQEAQFTLERVPGKTLTLTHWSLRVRNWAIQQWGHQGLQKIFSEQQIEPITQLTYFMLKDKDLFPTLDDFTDKIVTPKDMLTVISALLKSVGIGEPEVEKINQHLREQGIEPGPNAQAPTTPTEKIGEKSSTP